MPRLNPDDYCKACWKKVEEYVKGLDSGDVIAGKYIHKIREKYRKLLSQKDKYVYKVDQVDKVFKFFSLLNIEHKNSFVQIDLFPWQCFVLSYVFGFYLTNNPEKRLIREVLLFIARKAGKTAFAASIQLYGLLADGVLNAQSMLLANTAGQASVALNFAKAIVTHSPLLHKRLVPLRSRIVYRDPTKQGFCQVFSSMEPARLEGTSPSMCVLDEVFNWDDNSVYAAVKTGVGARINPLIMLISTAGNKNNGFLNDYLKLHKNILDEKIEDDTVAAFIFQPDEEDNLEDPNCWIKANPSLSYINTIEDLIKSYNQSKYSIADRYVFYTKHLNIFTDDVATWIPEHHLLPVFQDFDESQLLGRDCYIGMDLSKNTDLSSIALYFPSTTPGEPSYAIPYFWMADMEGNIVRRSGKDLSNYIFDGHITKCDTKTIDIELIYEKIIELSTRFNIICIYYDPYNAPVLTAKLKEAEIPVEIFKQTASKFNSPLKYLETAIYNRTIVLKNPALLWNLLNVVLYVDGNANIKIIKNKQADAVDGAVALAMAVGGWMSATYADETLGLEAYLNQSI